MVNMPPTAAEQRRSGFTLIELLVVITIIAILMALLLPAVQMIRETANVTTCRNQLKQMGLAFLNHEAAHGHLPTGGWGWSWVGVPERGFGQRQPGGWAYNILPYADQEVLHDIAKGKSGSDQKKANKKMVQTALPLFHCPSRRDPMLYTTRYTPRLTDRVNEVARSDYAVNCGHKSRNEYMGGPGSLSNGDSRNWSDRSKDQTGICFERSIITMQDVHDGASNTYCVGEKYLNPDHYETGRDPADNENVYVGQDNDIYRNAHRQLRRDKPGFGDTLRFGSNHINGVGFVFLDGSVHFLTFGLDLETHRRLANRADGKPVTVDDL